MAKELVPLVLSCAVWGPLLSGTRVEFRCDNRNVVDSVNKGSRSQQLCIYYDDFAWFLACFDTKNNNLPYPKHVERCSRQALQKPIKGVPAIKSPHFQDRYTDPNASFKNHIILLKRLDRISSSFPWWFMQAHHKQTSDAFSLTTTGAPCHELPRLIYLIICMLYSYIFML